MALRILVLEHIPSRRLVLVDGGIGDKEDAAFRERFAVEGPPLVEALVAGGYDPARVTDIVLTHLHFDHAGGFTRREPGGAVVPTFPAARHFLQASNRETALAPHPRERASYFAENVLPLADVALELVDGDAEVLPGIRVERTDGHTIGMQTVRIEGGGRVARYLADLAPTHHHVRIPYTMGYDMCARTLMEEKERLFAAAREEEAVLLFEHDATVAAATLVEERGKIVASPLVS
jgi:glyoxylase-like metal-dependent hydrolase (beta-lactamase superfamily II)